MESWEWIGSCQKMWLMSKQASIHCAQGTFSFLDHQGVLKDLKSGQQVYFVKLNKVEELEDESKPIWLQEFLVVFPKDRADIHLPPSREINHEIKIFLESKLISKRPYKSSLPKAIELKE